MKKNGQKKKKTNNKQNSQLWQISKELDSLAALLQCADADLLESSELIGLGLIIESISKKLAKLNKNC